MDSQALAPRQERATGHDFRTSVNMIIVSEPSADITRPVRTARSAPERRCSSAACMTVSGTQMRG
jgi:hypothetical protein